jgi:hypothetical protein
MVDDPAGTPLSQKITFANASKAITPEGTNVLSTGEAGGSKFLREDGDGTSSWQAIPGGGDALVASPLSQFAATTSLQLKNTISDETGSGALVFADTPTLVTPALGAATGTSLQLSGLTASEMLITDGSKNIASAAVATYPSLTELSYVKGVTSAAQTQLNQGKSTGVITGGVLSIGTGGAGVATTFSITSGTGQIVDNTVSPNTVTAVTWTTKTDVAVTNLLTNLVTFIAIDSGGNVIQSTTDFTPAQMREYIVLGIVVHSNLTTVNAVNQAQIVAYNQGNQLTDLAYGLGLFNVSGNVFSPNGANLKVNKSAGSIFRRGANYTTLSDNPHIITTASLTQGSLRMQNQTGAGSSSTTDIDVANYDLAGVTTAISPATRFSVLRVFLFQSNLIAVQRGQATYQSLAEAKAAIQTENFVTNDVLAANGLLRGFIVAQANATDLSDASKAFFIDAGKFGGTSGVGGLSVSTLQNAYDNSSSPEILTDSTRGALSVKRGSGADTDTILEGLNNANTTTFSVTGNGVINSAPLTASEMVITDASKNVVSAPVATYPSLTELSYVKGVTSAVQTQLNAKQASGATLTSLEGLSLVEGDVLYATGADTLARLPKGTANQEIRMNAGATAPEWYTPSAGGVSTRSNIDLNFAVSNDIAHFTRNAAGTGGTSTNNAGFAEMTSGTTTTSHGILSVNPAGLDTLGLSGVYGTSILDQMPQMWLLVNFNHATSSGAYANMGVTMGNYNNGASTKHDMADSQCAIGFYASVVAGVGTLYAYNKTSAGDITETDITASSKSINQASTARYDNCGWVVSEDSADIKFYMNGTLVATHTTNIPTGRLQSRLLTAWSTAIASNTTSCSLRMSLCNVSYDPTKS